MVTYPKILSLCTGIGGLDLGVKLTLKSKLVCCVESDPYCASVLVARMEDKALDQAPIWDDIRTFDPRPWSGKVDIILGGYPCQPFSCAGNKQGGEDPRHLWPEFKRIIGELRPQMLFLENVQNHLSVGFKEVLEDIAELRYNAVWGVFSNKQMGAPHTRKRLFCLSYSHDSQWEQVLKTCQESRRHSQILADPFSPTLGTQPREERREKTFSTHPGIWPPGQESDQWAIIDPQFQVGVEPEVPRMAYGSTRKLDPSFRSDRYRAVGNAVSPIVAAIAFRVLLNRVKGV